MLNNTNDNISNESVDRFNLSINGYEGPIDLLLDLAKKQRVDLSNISILDLAEQYLIFIQKFKQIHLEIAADYLVMAAWLTYLKSRLLIPKEDDKEEGTPEQLEAALKFQLQRLLTIQNISKLLYSEPIIGRETFYRGFSNDLKFKYNITYSSSLYNLIKSYANIIKQKEFHSLTIESSEIQTVESAIRRLKNIFSTITEWTNFLNLIPDFVNNKTINKSYVSSNFVATLELAKNGFIELKQKETFGNIFIRVKNYE